MYDDLRDIKRPSNYFYRSEKERQMIKKKLRDICKNKVRYKTSQEAWEAAAFYYVFYGGEKIYNVYACNQGNTKNHFHLTTNTSLGDLSQIPEELRPLFKTYKQEVNVSFWSKLRKFIGC